MKKRERGWFYCLAMMAFSAAPLSSVAQENGRAIGAVIAPPDLIAAYSCATYAEGFFLPGAKTRAMALLRGKEDKQAVMKRLLQDYDSQLESMCKEITGVFRRQRDTVLDAYSRQIPGTRDDIKPFLAKPEGRRWASDNAAFLTMTAPLGQYYQLVQAVAPELLQMPSDILDRDTVSEVRETSVGNSAEFERQYLIVLLSDPGFAKVAPTRFALGSLKRDEIRLRKEASKLRFSTSFPWFNGNASDLVRMHFNGFDVMREIGLAEVYLNYSQWMEKLQRQN